MNEATEGNKALEKLIGIGTEIAGAVAGTATGLLMPGPPGALIGAAATPILATTFTLLAAEIMHRSLGKREQVRIGAALAFAVEKIEDNVKRGQQVRGDGFFYPEPGKRPAAEEIAEGVLIVAQREHEESKLRFFGNLLANLAFHPEIDRPYANLLVRLGERLSYRQLCLLAVFSNTASLDLRSRNYLDTQVAGTTIAVLQEAMDLYLRELINSGNEAVLGMGYITPAQVTVQGPGKSLYALMELWTLPPDDVGQVAALLR